MPPDKKELMLPASEFNIKYPDNKSLEEAEIKRIRNAVTEGGIAIETKTYLHSKKLPVLLNTDKKGVNIVLNNAPDEDLKRIGQEDYLSTPHVQKEIAKRREQPRNLLEREWLKYSGECISAFSNNYELEKRTNYCFGSY